MLFAVRANDFYRSFVENSNERAMVIENGNFSCDRLAVDGRNFAFEKDLLERIDEEFHESLF